MKNHPSLLRRVAVTVAGLAAVSSMAHAAHRTYLEVPGASCTPFDDENDVQRSNDGIVNNTSASDYIVFCPLQAVKDTTFITTGPTLVSDAQVFYSDRNSRNQDLWCRPEAATMAGGLLFAPQQFAPNGRSERQSFFWTNPFASVDFSGQLLSLDIQCALPAATANGKSRIHAVKMTFEYPNT